MRAIVFLIFAFGVIIATAAKADGIPSLQPNSLGCTLEMPSVSRNRAYCGNYEAPNSQFKCAREVVDYTVIGLTLPNGRPGASSLIIRQGEILKLPFNLAAGLSTGSYQVGLKLKKGAQILDMKFPFRVDDVAPGVEITKLHGNTIIMVGDTTSTISEVKVIVRDRKNFIANDVADIAVNDLNSNLLRDQTYTIRTLLPDNALIYVSDEVGNRGYYRVDGLSPDSEVEKYLSFLEVRSLPKTSSSAVQGGPIEGPIFPVVYNYSPSISSNQLAANLKKVVQISEGTLHVLSRLFQSNGVNVSGFPESALAFMKFYIREVGSDKLQRVHLSGTQVVVDENISIGSLLQQDFTEEDRDGLSRLKFTTGETSEWDNSAADRLFDNAAAVSGSRHLIRDRVLSFYESISEHSFVSPVGGGAPIARISIVSGVVPRGSTTVFVTLEPEPPLLRDSQVAIHELMHSYGFPHLNTYDRDEFLETHGLMDPVGPKNESEPRRLSRSESILLAARIWGIPHDSAAGPSVVEEFRVNQNGSEFWLQRELCGDGQISHPPSTPRTAQPFNRTVIPAEIGNAQSDLPKPPAFPETLRTSVCVNREKIRGKHFDFQAMKGSDWRFILPGSIDRFSGLPQAFNEVAEPLLEFRRLKPGEPTELAFFEFNRGILNPNLKGFGGEFVQLPNFSNLPGRWPWLVESFAAKLELPPSGSIDGRLFILGRDAHREILVLKNLDTPLGSYFRRNTVWRNGDLHTFANIVAIGYKPAELEPITPRDSKVWHPDNPVTLGGIG